MHAHVNNHTHTNTEEGRGKEKGEEREEEEREGREEEKGREGGRERERFLNIRERLGTDIATQNSNYAYFYFIPYRGSDLSEAILQTSSPSFSGNICMHQTSPVLLINGLRVGSSLQQPSV